MEQQTLEMDINAEDAIASDAAGLLCMSMGSKTRMRILTILHVCGPTSVSRLAEMTKVTSPAISQNLHLLKKTGLVTYTRDAQMKNYELSSEAVHEFVKHALDFAYEGVSKQA